MNLKEAIEKLEKFTLKQEGRTFPSLFADETPLLQKVIRLLHLAFSEKERSQHAKIASQIAHEVEHAVRVIKSHHILLENYRKGDPEQRILAQRASDLFNRYNTLVDLSKNPPKSWKTHLAHLYFKVSGFSIGLDLHKIELPPPALIASRLPKLNIRGANLRTRKFREVTNDPTTLRVGSLFHPEGHPDPLSKRESDAFRAKMFSLLKEHRILFTSQAEEVAFVQAAYLHFSQNGNKVTVRTTLTPYPGEEIYFEGVFERHPEALVPSVPMKESFKLQYQNIQTGFPYPGEHHGGLTWADQLLPVMPHHPQELPLLTPLFERKKILALELHERGDTLLKAKKQFVVRREMMNKHSSRFIELHKKLAISFLEASEQDYSIEVIDKFFSFLTTIPSPFDYLAETHQILTENILSLPFTQLQLLRYDEDKQKEWNQKDARMALEEGTHRILEELLHQKGDPITLDYLHLMGKTTSSPAHEIMLQHLSEGMQMAPPMLNSFEQRVQAVLYFQLNFFLERRESSLENLQEMIEQEIVLYDSSEIEDPFVEELEVYFNSRYYEHLSRSR